MSQQWYDPSSKWLMEEHPASILYAAGVRSVVSCRARKAEVVQPRKLPDGLLEARLTGEKQSRLFLVEVATYPEERVVTQVFAQLHFDKPNWLEILGGRKAMSESPLIKNIVEEARQTEWVEITAQTLLTRFKQVTPTITAGLAQVMQKDRRKRLTNEALTCDNVQAFEKRLLEELPKQPPPRRAVNGARARRSSDGGN